MRMIRDKNIENLRNLNWLKKVLNAKTFEGVLEILGNFFEGAKTEQEMAKNIDPIKIIKTIFLLSELRRSARKKQHLVRIERLQTKPQKFEKWQAQL